MFGTSLQFCNIKTEAQLKLSQDKGKLFATANEKNDGHLYKSILGRLCKRSLITAK